MFESTEGTTGGRAIVSALRAAGVDHAFCVPGESFLGLLDALYDNPSIRVIATRHEGGASFMAEAYGMLTRRPAVCMGTRMVGGGNLAIGIHTARQNGTPMIAMMGQVSTAFRHREAFQEANLEDTFAPIAKWAVEPPTAERLGELTLRAARVAISGRQGPVVVSLREDLLDQSVEPFEPEPLRVPRSAPRLEDVQETLRLLRSAERPVMLLGVGVLAEEASDLYVRLAEAEQVPAIAAWRHPDVLPNQHPLYLGHGGIGAVRPVAQRLLDADVVLAVGVRLDEYTTVDYQVPGPGQVLVHVDSGPEDLGGHRQATVPIVSDARAFGEALVAAAERDSAAQDLLDRRRDRNAADRCAWESVTTPGRGRSRPGYVDQQAVTAHLRKMLPADAIVTTDAGNFGAWPARYLRFGLPGRFLGPISGAMGYAVPAAVGAKLARPKQPVVAFVGDGGFLMTGTEMETAVRASAPIVALVYDNTQFGTIRMHQIREHPGRQIATALGPVDFAAVARGLGAEGFTVRDDADFPEAFQEALGCGKPALLHLRVDPEQISVATDTAGA